MGITSFAFFFNIYFSVNIFQSSAWTWRESLRMVIIDRVSLSNYISRIVFAILYPLMVLTSFPLVNSNRRFFALCSLKWERKSAMLVESMSSPWRHPESLHSVRPFPYVFHLALCSQGLRWKLGVLSSLSPKLYLHYSSYWTARLLGSS